MCVVTRKLERKGRYTATVAYLPLEGSVVNPSRDSARFRVRR